MKFSYPLEAKKAEEVNAVYKTMDGGYYPVGKNNFWHGGIHLSSVKPVRAIADGKVIAYRITRQNLTTVIAGRQQVYTNNFVLVEHNHKTPKGQETRFWSLYMHLLPWNDYRPAQGAPKDVPKFFVKKSIRVKSNKNVKVHELTTPPNITLPLGSVLEYLDKDTTHKTRKVRLESEELWVNREEIAPIEDAYWDGTKYTYKIGFNRTMFGYRTCSTAGVPDQNTKVELDVSMGNKIQRIRNSGRRGKYRKVIVKTKRDAALRPTYWVYRADMKCKWNNPEYTLTAALSKVYGENPGTKVISTLGPETKVTLLETAAWENKPGKPYQLDPAKHAANAWVDGDFLEIFWEDIPKTFDRVVIPTKNIKVKGGDLLGHPGRFYNDNEFHLEVFTDKVDFMSNSKADEAKFLLFPERTLFKRKEEIPLIGNITLPKDTILTQLEQDDANKTRKVRLEECQELWVKRDKLGSWDEPSFTFSITNSGQKFGYADCSTAGVPDDSTKVEIDLARNERVQRILNSEMRGDYRKIRAKIKKEDSQKAVYWLYRADMKSKWHDPQYWLTQPLSKLYAANPGLWGFQDEPSFSLDQNIETHFDQSKELKKGSDMWHGFTFPGKTEKWWMKKSDCDSFVTNCCDWGEFFTKMEELPTTVDGYCDIRGIIDRIEAIQGNTADGLLTTDEIQRAVQDPGTNHWLSRLVCKHPTEWSAATDQEIEKYKKFSSATNSAIQAMLQGELLPFIQSLQWWDDVFKPTDANAPNPKELWFFHPIAFVEHWKKIADNQSTITKEQLKAILPAIKDRELNRYLDPLNQMFKNYNITSRLEQAHFIAQVAHESANFSKTKEGYNWSEELYFSYLDPEPENATNSLSTTSNPTLDNFLRFMNKLFNENFTIDTYNSWVSRRAIDNGNIDAGDGVIFRGRGLIHLTWRKNYIKYAKYRQLKYGESGTIDRNYGSLVLSVVNLKK